MRFQSSDSQKFSFGVLLLRLVSTWPPYRRCRVGRCDLYMLKDSKMKAFQLREAKSSPTRTCQETHAGRDVLSDRTFNFAVESSESAGQRACNRAAYVLAH